MKSRSLPLVGAQRRDVAEDAEKQGCVGQDHRHDVSPDTAALTRPGQPPS